MQQALKFNYEKAAKSVNSQRDLISVFLKGFEGFMASSRLVFDDIQDSMKFLDENITQHIENVETYSRIELLRNNICTRTWFYLCLCFSNLIMFGRLMMRFL
jgi:hypothetical protein